MNVRYLKLKFIQEGIKISDAAKEMNLGKSTLYRKLSGKSEFTQFEITYFIHRFHLSVAELNHIFFDS